MTKKRQPLALGNAVALAAWRRKLAAARAYSAGDEGDYEVNGTRLVLIG